MDILSYILASGSGGGGEGSSWHATTLNLPTGSWSSKKMILSLPDVPNNVIMIVGPATNADYATWNDYVVKAYSFADNSLDVRYETSKKPGTFDIVVAWTVVSDSTTPVLLNSTPYNGGASSGVNYGSFTITPDTWSGKIARISLGISRTDIVLIAGPLGEAAQNRWTKYKIHVKQFDTSAKQLQITYDGDEVPSETIVGVAIWFYRIGMIEPICLSTMAKPYAPTTTTVTLTSSGWSNNTQTVNVSSVTATSSVDVAPNASSHMNYCNSGVYCSAQADGSLTFTCATTPSSDIVVNIKVG